jgi:carboxyl-terminal processing protease
MLRTFALALRVVEENYADPVSPDRAMYGSIQAMLEKLDPHSFFLDPKSFQKSNEEMRGNYCGLGVTFAIVRNRPTIIHPPIPGTPAYRLGIRSGDIIVRIEGREVSSLSLQQMGEMMKGVKGTRVQLTLERPGLPGLLDLAVVRDEIPQYSIPCAFSIRPGVGYVRISKFTETTESELEERFRRLGASPEGLILDLRGNHGGYLPGAIAVAGAFLQSGQEIVTTRGRQVGSNQKFVVKKQVAAEKCPLVVLVDRESASSSEIVAGAIQDHDRGLILGETSFGKGLVQTVFPLSHGAGLWLTTARYYTPSGRLIQRDYSHQSLFDYHRHAGSNTARSEIKQTDSGRSVFGGGGISPDILLSLSDQQSLTTAQARLLNRSTFFDFVRTYNQSHPGSSHSFEVSEAVLSEFRNYLKINQLDFTHSEWRENLPFFREQIRYEYLLAWFGLEEAQKVVLEKDTAISKALDSLPQAKALFESSRPILAGKAVPRPS